MAARGLFITVEGGEGVGKTTNLAFLHDFLVKHGVDVLLTREPGGTAVGERIRELLLLPANGEPVSDLTELLLIFAARAQHINELILPALTAGRWVLSDRFTDATYAYQCGGRGLAVDAVRRLEELVQDGLQPDYTILLDTPVATGMERVRGRGELDRIELEGPAFFERVRRTYLERAANSSGRFRVIDASVSLEDVQRQLHKVGEELLGCWRARRHEQ